MSEINVKIIKTQGRMVYGWGSICKVRDADGKLVDYVDTDNEVFPEDVTTDAWAEFMVKAASMDVMHDEQTMGRVTFAMPMTEDVAEAFGILDSLQHTGVMVGVRVDDDAVLAKFRSGLYTGFSIGGSANFEDVK